MTIRDVAKRAGVSISTVSRVLNNTCKVREDKRLRVEEAVRVLGYTPNQVARSLLRKETGGIGVLLPYVGGEFFAELLHGIDVTTRENGYFLLISTSHGSLEEMKVALKGMHMRVDGLVIMAPESDEEAFRALLPDNLPVVLINARSSIPPHDTINFDNYTGAFRAVRHLLDHGHRRIAMLKGPEMAYDAQERVRGYREALKSFGVEPRAEFEIPGDFTPEAGYKAADLICKLDPRPSAVFGANDQSTIALMAALNNQGLQIPESLSVIGFDNIPSARFTAPPLTTVDVPIQLLGIAAIERLLEIIKNGEQEPRHRILPAQLALRQSATDA